VIVVAFVYCIPLATFAIRVAKTAVGVRPFLFVLIARDGVSGGMGV
jgi:hypothetical protein